MGCSPSRSDVAPMGPPDATAVPEVDATPVAGPDPTFRSATKSRSNMGDLSAPPSVVSMDELAPLPTAEERERRSSVNRRLRGSGAVGSGVHAGVLGASMGISGVLPVSESHNWESERKLRQRLPRADGELHVGGGDDEAIRSAISKLAAESGGPPILLSAPQLAQASLLQQSIQREAVLDDAAQRATETWRHMKELQDSTMPDELGAFCDLVEDEEQHNSGATLPGAAPQ